MDFQLTEEQNLLKSSVSWIFKKNKWTTELENEYHSEKKFPRELYGLMAEMGLLGISFPEEFGGAGLSVLDQVIVVEELAKHSMLAANLWFVPVFGGGYLLDQFGSKAQKECYLPKMIKSEVLPTLGIAEEAAGADLSGVKTEAVSDREGYILTGEKIFVSLWKDADLAFILTLVREGKQDTGHHSLLMLPLPAEGVDFETQDKLGVKALPWYKVRFHGVKIKKEGLLLGEEEGLGQGIKQIQHLQSLERILAASKTLGLAQLAFGQALDYAKKREQFGRPIGKFQIIAHMLAEVAAEIEAVRAFVYSVAWKMGGGWPCLKEASMAKLLSTEIAERACLDGVQVMGGYGYMMEVDMQRHLRDSILEHVAWGSSEIQKNDIARELGL